MREQGAVQPQRNKSKAMTEAATFSETAMREAAAALAQSIQAMMSIIAFSLPEAIILRKVLKPRLLATFFGVVALGILLVGYLFNFLM